MTSCFSMWKVAVSMLLHTEVFSSLPISSKRYSIARHSTLQGAVINDLSGGVAGGAHRIESTRLLFASGIRRLPFS